VPRRESVVILLRDVLADHWIGINSDANLLKPDEEKDWDGRGGRWRVGEYMQKAYDKVDWVFALLAAASVGVQGVKTVATPESLLNEYCKCLFCTSSSSPSLISAVQ
jgi:hypothetical protein